MREFLERMFTSEAYGVLTTVVTLALAFIVAVPVAWDRERAHRAAGLRTFPLVSAASAAFVMIGREAIPSGSAGMHYIIQGLMTGLGFLGAGVIIQSGDDRVRGTATATALWSTAAIGAAVAYSRLEIALVIVAIDLIGLRLLAPLKKVMKAREERPTDKEPRKEDTAPA
jgi:putative Mg2+ transporter-C (MgtC) family protein